MVIDKYYLDSRGKTIKISAIFRSEKQQIKWTPENEKHNNMDFTC